MDKLNASSIQKHISKKMHVALSSGLNLAPVYVWGLYILPVFVCISSHCRKHVAILMFIAHSVCVFVRALWRTDILSSMGPCIVTCAARDIKPL